MSVGIHMSLDEHARLVDYLEAHEQDIAYGIDDYGALRELFSIVIGRPPRTNTGA